MRKFLTLLALCTIGQLALAQTYKSIYRSDGPVVRIPVHLIDTVRTASTEDGEVLSVQLNTGLTTQVPLALIDSITHREGSVVNPTELGAIVYGSVMGVVTDHTGNAVIDAVVYAGFSSEQTITDTNGVFFLDSIAVFERLGLIRVEKDGYFKGSRSFIPIVGGRNLLRIELSPRVLIGSFQAATGGSVTTEGLSVMFPPNSIARDGQSYAGMVNVYATVFDPTESTFNYRMPGDLIGGKGDSLQMLRSFGMADVEITDDAGVLVQIAPGYDATLTLTVPDIMLAEAPSQIDFWSFDTELGYWLHEGEAVLAGNTYVGMASHFSPWNCDMGFVPVALTVECTDGEGRPITNGRLISDWTLGGSSVYTDLTGTGNLWVRLNQSVEINLSVYCEVSNEWEIVSTQTIAPLSAAGSTVMSGQLPDHYRVAGTILDCEGGSIRNGYIQSNPGGIHFLVNGAFSYYLCTTGEIVLKAFNLDGDSFQASGQMSIYVGVNGVDVPTLSTCEAFDGLIDIDGNIYSTVVIGNQEWMAENLRTTKFRNGEIIPTGLSGTQWQNSSSSTWSHYNNSASYDTPYGKLYNGLAASDSRGLCPEGWHVPTDAQWTTLSNYLGGESIAGGKMKSTQYWTVPNTSATNSSGFSGLPSGYRVGASFVYLGSQGYWWSSTYDSGSSNWLRKLSYDSESLLRYSNSGQYGYSVRCIRD